LSERHESMCANAVVSSVSQDVAFKCAQPCHRNDIMSFQEMPAGLNRPRLATAGHNALDSWVTAAGPVSCGRPRQSQRATAGHGFQPPMVTVAKSSLSCTRFIVTAVTVATLSQLRTVTVASLATVSIHSQPQMATVTTKTGLRCPQLASHSCLQLTCHALASDTKVVGDNISSSPPICSPC
jgi:hypothetical protein